MADNDTAQDNADDTAVQNLNLDDAFDDAPKGDKGDKPEAKTEPAGKVDDKEKPEPPAGDEDDETVDKSVAGLTKGISEERRKRQEAEKERDALKAKLANADDPEAEEVPDPTTDKEGYERYLANKNNLANLQNKVNLSRDLMIDAKGKEDYEAKENVFVTLARENPYLIDKMNASPNPARFAYETAVEHLETQKLRDPEAQKALRAKIKEEVRAEVLAEIEAEKKGKKPAAKSALEVPNLTQATAAGTNSDKTIPVADLDDVLKDSPLDKRSYG